MQNPIQIMPYVKELNPRIIFNVFHKIAYYFIVYVFVTSGISKLYNPFSLLESMRLSLPIPTMVLIAIVAFIAILETLLGLFLLLHIKVRASLVAVSILLVFAFIYTLFCFYNNIPGEAGFFGGLFSYPFDMGMVIKNSVLILISLLLLIKEFELPE